ncbi:MAG: sulfatase-like hydrolase/transferase, partial [Aestuariivirgaceae bacterium]|nr:sulfatase-like hydrolase/transferase [Aestuariivirgaceae bacterium]
MAAAATLALSAQLLVTQADAGSRPNILFVIMDDAGIDQFSAFGYGGASPAVTPVIDTIADAGIKFRNTWAMPECSNGRMALLTGRYPFRTNVYQAIGERDLANSHASPYDVTVPKMLKKAGYKNALFGKYHLGGPENNQAGDGAPRSMGWDYFYGWTGGLPASIDTTAGGVGDEGTYMCGYVPNTARDKGEGADTGACYVPTSRGARCHVITGDSDGDSPGLACLGDGGILVPNAACSQTPPGNLNFSTLNSQYVSQLVINSKSAVKQVSP